MWRDAGDIDPADGDYCDDTSHCCGIVCVLGAIVMFVLCPVYWYLAPRFRARSEMASTPFGRTTSRPLSLQHGLVQWLHNTSSPSTRTLVRSSGAQALYQRRQSSSRTSVHSHSARDTLAARRISGPSVRATAKRKATFEAEALQNVRCRTNETGDMGMMPKQGEPPRALPKPSRPVLLFTHLRRTGGTVLSRKQVLFPAIACEHGLVATQGYCKSSRRRRGARRRISPRRPWRAARRPSCHDQSAQGRS